MKRTGWLVGIGTLVLLGGVFGALYFTSCADIAPGENQTGSHGFRIFAGSSLISFAHGVRNTCVPAGWEPVGAAAEGTGWAKFQNGMTGVIIKSDAFATTSMSFTKSAYRLTVLYPKTLDASLVPSFKNAIANAFERTGAEFGDSASNTPREHTILITAGLGASFNEYDAVYPDPNGNVTYFIMPPSTPRGEELFIHAVQHLYNRERPELDGYGNNQGPFPAENWQELEATWAETAFRTSNAGRLARLEYLYNVHTAVQTDNFSLINQPPFDDEAAFHAIHRSVPTGGNVPYLDEQYGVYVLTPLATVATEGLLQYYGGKTDIESILTALHEGTVKNYFDELSKYLPADALAKVKSWYFDGVTIPENIVLAGAAYYDKKNAALK